VSLAFFYGTFMRGQPGEANLAGASFLEEARTAPRYRLYSIRDEHPLLIEAQDEGVSVDGQLFDVPDELWESIVSSEPPGARLHFDELELVDGRVVQTMFGEREQAEREGVDISEHGGWAAYASAKNL
jgi:gamma-glutamylcyclotransferase (GGCT)/AIG2-like uncharacterized protein YtfP